MNKITLDCGCEFDTDEQGRLLMEFDINKINFQCEKAWDLIGSGHTTGLFQIDSGLGQTMSKQLKPENIDHLAALISIMRPSCLQGKLDDGKSIAQHFIDRKNKLEPSYSQYQSLEPILKHTYNLMIYQEQAIKIGQEIAGMSLQDSDHYIRYGIGKKKSDIISKGKDIFLNGCKKIGQVDVEESKKIWDWIESAQRYQFNAGHAYSYAYTTYWTAIGKTHFPHRFYKSYLNHSYNKPKPLEEIKNLVLDSKAFKVDICNPDLRLMNNKFVEKDGHIYFGLQYVKEVGESAIKSFRIALNSTELTTLSWTALLFKILLQVNRNAVRRLIGVGALDYLNIDRKKLLYEFDIVLKFSKSETAWIIKNLDLNKYTSILGVLQEILSYPTGRNQPVSNKNRKNILKNLETAIVNPPYRVISTIEEIINWEKSFLGISLSCSPLDLVEKSYSDTFVKEFNDGKSGKMKLIVELNKVKIIKTKKNDEMAFVSASDTTGIINDITIFPNTLSQYKNILYENNCVLIAGYKGNRDNFIVTEMRQV